MTEARDVSSVIVGAARLLGIPGVTARHQIHGSNVEKVATLLRAALAEVDTEEHTASTWVEVRNWLEGQLGPLGVEPAPRTLAVARDKVQAYLAERGVSLEDLALGVYRGGRDFEKWQAAATSVRGSVPPESRPAAVRLFTVLCPHLTVVLYQKEST